jgi:hypothetical protein
LDGNLVEGFNVDKDSPKPDCVACTEAKQHTEPFPESTTRHTEPGELTHIDLWGKYAIKSINGHQYYLLFVDNAKRYITVQCLKEKSDSTQGVIKYLAHLITQGRNPRGIQIDCGTEFVNQKLKEWCNEHGIEIRLTAPYSPSQNGIAERMNRTLVELLHAMIAANELPEFLWEYAVLHAAYVQNRSFMKHLPKSMPYEGWHNKKPNVAHLCEFGSPVWVLLQGQKEPQKMQPKSKCQVYVGYDDGARAVKYYNAETCNVLTSRNFRNITPPEQPSPPELIEVTPDMPREGESTSTTPPTGVTDSDDITRNLGPKKRKRNETEEDIDIEEPRKTRGIRTDYKHLHNPFTYEEEDNTFLSMEEVYAIIAGDELMSLKDAKNSPDWPEWQKAMKTELDLLTEKGTWELVQKPPDAVPISNKWIFVKKWNKDGEVVRYRARLVAKGYAQRPGFDYRETFSPVVRMDTLRAILALIPEKDLKLHQMDVKGAYLNSTLQETIYMQQPEGCEDGMGQVCRLVKSLYGLKQAGCEWNNELDGKLKVHEYERLLSDPCAYI